MLGQAFYRYLSDLLISRQIPQEILSKPYCLCTGSDGLPQLKMSEKGTPILCTKTQITSKKKFASWEAAMGHLEKRCSGNPSRNECPRLAPLNCSYLATYPLFLEQPLTHLSLTDNVPNVPTELLSINRKKKNVPSPTSISPLLARGVHCAGDSRNKAN